MSYGGFHYSDQKSENDWSKYDANSYFFELGLLKSLNEFIYLDFGLNYRKSWGDSKLKRISFNVGISTYIK